jgi:hypothetical protein
MSTPGAGAMPDMGLDPVDLATIALTSLAVADALSGDLNQMVVEEFMPELG